MKIKIARYLPMLLLLGSGTVLLANPFAGVTSAADTIKTVATAGGAILGGLITLIGGSIAAWKAAHGEPFTKPLVFAIVAFVIASVSIAAW